MLLEGALGSLGTAAPQGPTRWCWRPAPRWPTARDDYPLRVKLALDALDLPCTTEPADVTVRHAAGFEEETAARVRGRRLGRLQGALTGPLLERLLRAGTRCTLVVADATRVLARPQQVARARRGGVEVLARRPLAIAAVTSSPFHPDRPLRPRRGVLGLFDAAAGRWPVVDVVSGRISA